MREWTQNDQHWPYQDAKTSRFMVFVHLAELKGLLVRELGIKWSGAVLSSEEEQHAARVVRWKDHLPWSALRDDPDGTVAKASNHPTIVVIGDIRSSQDLVTYSPRPEDFSRRMVEFIARTRQLIGEHDGLFDKFTGDGFLAYFNEAICRKDYTDCFLTFLDEELGFCREHLGE
jgi:class 3 adenylate cyclase